MKICYSRLRHVWVAWAAALFAVGAILASTQAIADDATIHLQIADGLSPQQVEEEIAISINHVPVGTLKVNADKTKDTLTVTVPAAKTYHYDLCGHLKQRAAGGKVVERKIDNGGNFAELDGRILTAYNSNAVVFYLVDETNGQLSALPSLLTAGHSCGAAVAMR